MSLLGIFDIGKSAIFASQTALNVAGHNISNVNTPGYSRQELILEPAAAVSIGGNHLGRGVTTPDVRRHYDQFLQSQLLQQKQSYGRSLSLGEGLGHAEQIFNEASGMGLSTAISDFFNAWNDVANNPGSQSQRTVLLQKAETLVERASTMESGLEDLIVQTEKELSNVIGQVNTLAEEIASTNEMILRAEAGGTQRANDLRDTRERLLGDLAELVEFNHFEAPDGMVTVIVDGKNLVDKKLYTPLEGVRQSDGSLKLFMDGAEVGDGIRKGRMGGLMATRDAVKDQLLTPLRKVIASLVHRVNEQHALGYDLNAEAGGDFFQPPVADPETEYEGVIKDLAVAFSDPRKVAAASAVDPSTGEALPGNNENALAMAAIASADIDISGTSATLETHYSSLVTAAGSLSFTAQDNMSFEATLLDDIQFRRDSVSSVSLDEEAANMVRFQRAFQAGARLVSVTDELLQTVLQML